MDTGDTGSDTGQEEEGQGEGISAAELAGETGGISCNASGTSGLTLITLLFLCAGIMRRFQ